METKAKMYLITYLMQEKEIKTISVPSRINISQEDVDKWAKLNEIKYDTFKTTLVETKE